MIKRGWYLLFVATCISTAYSMQVPYRAFEDEIELAEIVVGTPRQNQSAVQIRQIVSKKNDIETVEEFENIYHVKVAEKNNLIEKRKHYQNLIGTARRSTAKYTTGCLFFLILAALYINEQIQLDIRWDQFLAQSNLFIVLPLIYFLSKIPKGAYQNFLKYKTLQRQLLPLTQSIETYQGNEARFSPDNDFYWQCTKIITRQQI